MGENACALNGFYGRDGRAMGLLDLCPRDGSRQS